MLFPTVEFAIFFLLIFGMSWAARTFPHTRKVILLLASYWEGKLELPGFPVTLKEVDVMPSSMYGRRGAARDVDVAAALLGREPVIAETLVTHRFPLEAAPEAFAVARDRAAGSIKVVLEP